MSLLLAIALAAAATLPTVDIVRGKDPHPAVAIHGAQVHHVELGELGEFPSQIRALSKVVARQWVEAGDKRYAVLELSFVRPLNTNGQCGTGPEKMLLWLELDAKDQILRSSRSQIESCLDGLYEVLNPDCWSLLSGGHACLIQGSRRYELRYDPSHPENALTEVADRPLRKVSTPPLEPKR